MSNPRTPLEPDTFYHIYNHAVGNENLFRQQKNYFFFLDRIEKWILPCCDIHSYCLMPNHFHFLLRVLDQNFLANLWQDKIFKRLKKIIPELVFSQYLSNQYDDLNFRIQRAAVIDKLINEQFSHCFNSYVQSFNNAYDRKGSLLRESFNRKKIESDDYLKTLICYIHNNPVLTGFVSHAEDWKYSSYNLIVSEKPTFVRREEVVELFDSIENFLFAHKEHLSING